MNRKIKVSAIFFPSSIFDILISDSTERHFDIRTFGFDKYVPEDHTYDLGAGVVKW